MKRSLLMVIIIAFLVSMLGCEMGNYDDLLFFYKEEVVANDGTDATWEYSSEGYVVIMTRWYESDPFTRPKNSKATAVTLQGRTEFSLEIQEGDYLTKKDALSVEEFQDGCYEVAQRYYFMLPRGTYTLEGETRDTNISPHTQYLSRTINLTIQ